MSLRAEEYFESLKRDGFVLLRDFLDPRLVHQARQEIEKWAQADILERTSKNAPEGGHTGVAGYTHLNAGKHMLIDCFAKSATLDRLFEQMLSHPDLAPVVERLAGKNKKLRGYIIRQMTGSSEQSAMEWHRDNRGEINWGMILSETAPMEDGATSFVPGSHLFPFCPFKHALFPMPYPGAKPPTKLSMFSRWLARRTLRNTVDAAGKPGDCYMFLGDTWHARRPNLNGKRGVVLLVGAFPAEMPFPTHTEVVIPQPEVLNQLSENFRKIVDYRKTPPNTDQKAYLYEMEERRQKMSSLSLWKLAQLEKRF